MGVNLKKNSPQIMLVFPKEYIERRKEIIKKVLPRFTNPQKKYQLKK